LKKELSEAPCDGSRQIAKTKPKKSKKQRTAKHGTSILGIFGVTVQVGRKGKQFGCPFCVYGSASYEKDIVRHVLTHRHADKEPLYQLRGDPQWTVDALADHVDGLIKGNARLAEMLQSAYCSICCLQYARKDSLGRHQKKKHSG
jgi:hypothetical protein